MSQQSPPPIPYKKLKNLQERKIEFDRIRAKFTDRIPIVCERAPKSKLPTTSKIKYLIPQDLTLGQFLFVIRKQIALPAHQAIFIIVGGNILTSSSSLSDVYSKYKDKDDGFLYITYTGENTFGDYTTS